MRARAHRGSPLTAGALAVLLAVGTSVVGVLGAVSMAPAAVADTAPAAGVPATVTADGLPTWQVNGVVWGQAVVGNTVYVTGSFTKARPPGVAEGGAGEVPAANLFAYDIRTGNRVASFDHALNAQGRVVEASPDGSRIYVGGEFSTVDGIAMDKLIAFDTTTNQLITSFNPRVAGKVSAIVTSADTVWMGGNFFSVGGRARTRLGAVAASTGAVLPWAPTADDDEVLSMVLTPDRSKMVIGGKFIKVNGTFTEGMGALDPVSGASLPWAANQTIHVGSNGSGITSLTTDGTQVIGSGFAWRGGSFEGTFGADPASGRVLWANDCHGDTYDTAPLNGILYLVGHMHDCSWIGEFPDVGGVWHHGLAFTTSATSRLNRGPDNYGWNYSTVPTSSLLHYFPDFGIGSYTGQYQAAWTVTGNADYVVYGGEFPRINGLAQQGLVRMAVPGRTTPKRGPVRVSTSDPTATSPASGRVVVSLQAAKDQDNAALTYQLYRSGVAAPIAETTASSSFYTLPTVTLTDTTARPGSTFTWSVRAVDANGNAVALGTTAALQVAGTPPANQPPTAAFTTATSLRSVTFTSQSTDSDGTVAQLAWDFGDGTPPGSTTPVTHAYARPGTYQVTLTATDNQGAATTSTRAVTVTNASPTARLATTADALVLSADGSSSTDPDGTLASWVWSWGDGTPAGSGARTSHTYAAAGTYQVTLTVTDADGATSTATSSVGVAANAAPVARFTSTTAQLGLGVDGRTSSDADGTVASWSWSWGDGTAPGAGSTATHTYAASGTYPVTLTVTDNRGATASTTTPVTVQATGGPLATDTFARTTTSSWGTADLGGAWSLRGSASSFSVAGGVGTIAAAPGGGPSAFLTGVSSSRTSSTVTFSTRAAPTGGGTFVYLAGRERSGGGGYRVALNLRADGKLTMGVLRRSAAGADTFLVPYAVVPGVAVTPGGKISVRFVVDGSGTTALRARAWSTGATEPTTWAIDTTDTTPELQGAGAVGLATYVSGSATAGSTTYVDFSNLASSEAQ